MSRALARRHNRSYGGRPGVWEYRPDSDAVWYDDTGTDVFTGASYTGTYLDDEVGRHIARHDPSRVLREVQANRVLLGYLRGELADDETDESARWLLGNLASIWASHPDFRSEWDTEEKHRDR